MPGNELTLPACSTHHFTMLPAALTESMPHIASAFSSLTSSGNTPLQPETMMMRFPDFFSPDTPELVSLPADQRDTSDTSMDLPSVSEALNQALLERKDDNQLVTIRNVLDNCPELPAGERGEIGATFWLKRRITHSAESTAEAFGISKALFYRQIALISPPQEELQEWVDTYMKQYHPGKQPSELNNYAKVRLTRVYFNHAKPSLNTSLWKLSALLKISGYSLRSQIAKQLAAETDQNSASKAQPSTESEGTSRAHDRTFYQEKDKYLLDTLNKQLAQDYPAKTLQDLMPDERQQLAIRYWQAQTVKPSLQRLAELTQTNRRTLVNRIQQIRSAPRELQKWVEEQLLMLPTDIQARYHSDKTLRLDLAMKFWTRIPPEFHVKKWQLAIAMQISPPSLSTRYRRSYLIPEPVTIRLKEVLAQRCAVLQQDTLSDGEKAQTGAALWLNELSAQIAEKALARQLAIDPQLLHQAIADLRAQSRQRTTAVKRKLVTPPPAEIRAVSPGPLSTDSLGRPRKTRENSIKKILKTLGMKAIQALPVSRKKTISHRHVRATASEVIPEVKLEPLALQQEEGVELVICGDKGEVLNSLTTAQRPLTKSFVIRNDLPILRDPLNPEKSLTLQAEGVTSAQQLEVSYWGNLKTFAKKRPKTEIARIVQQARDLVAKEGPALATWMERLMVCHESFAEDETGSLVALGQGVFNASGQVVPEGTVLGIVAGKFFQGNDALSLTRKQGSRNSLSHTWNSGSWENSVNSFNDRNLLSMLNCAALPGKPAVAKNNVGCFILGQKGNLICYFTTSPVAINQEYYIDYGEDYDPTLTIRHCQRDERIEASIERVVHQREVKPEPGEPEEMPQSATAHVQLSPYQHQLISDVYNSQGWQEKSSETLMLLLSYTRIFSHNRAVLVTVNEKYQFMGAWDSLNNERVAPQQLTGRRLAVIQHNGGLGTGYSANYHAFLPRNVNENMQFIRYHNGASYALAYSSCERINIPPSGFSLTHAAWVALTGEIHDFTQGEQLRQQLVDVIQSDAHKQGAKGHRENVEPVES